MSSDEKPYGDKCPKCRTEWSKVPRIVCAGYFWHCKICKKKADVLMKEDAEGRKSRPTPDWGYKGMFLESEDVHEPYTINVPDGYTVADPGDFRGSPSSVTSDDIDKAWEKLQQDMDQLDMFDYDDDFGTFTD